MSYGVTSTGFIKRTIEDLIAQQSADCIAEISASLDTSSSSPVGQLIAVLSAADAELWDAAQAIYTAFDPDNNVDAGQDATAAITGTIRNAASYSYVKMSLGLNAGVTVPAGSAVAVLGNPATSFVLVGPEPLIGAAVVPGPVISVGAGTYYGRFQASVTGPVVAYAGTLTAITTPITGWNSATNALDATLGANVESNAAMRARREAELAAGGSSSVDALRVDLLQLPGMRQAVVFENVTDYYDANSVPPHAIECLCYDGPGIDTPNDVIAQTIWDGKAAGIRPFGVTIYGHAIDKLGVTQTVYFSRPTIKTVYFTIDISVDPIKYPSGGDALIKAAIVAKGAALLCGDDVTLTQFYASIYGATTGVLDVPAFRAGFSASPSGTTNLIVAAREIATFDTTRIVLNHV